MLSKKIGSVLMLSVFAFMLNAQKVARVHESTNVTSFDVKLLPDPKPDAFLLSLENPTRKNLRLTISHRDLGAVVDTTIASGEYTTRFNFDEAMDGRYMVIVENGKEKFSKEIELSTVTLRRMKFD